MRTEEEIRKKLDSLVHSNIALVSYINKRKENNTELTRKTFYENNGMQYALEWVLEEQENGH